MDKLLPMIDPVGWVALTVAAYAAALSLNRRRPAWWSAPVLVTSVVMLVLLLTLHVGYHTYMRGGQWLMLLLGPAVVAFAVPIYRCRALIRKHWRVMVIGVLAGSTLSVVTSLILAMLLHLSPELRASLLPRSITTPFAMAVSRDIGGSPALTATFTIITGLFGGVLAGPLLRGLGLTSGFARGFLLGMGAHGLGTARAWELGAEEGSVAGTVMVLAGLANVLLGTLYLGVSGVLG